MSWYKEKEESMVIVLVVGRRRLPDCLPCNTKRLRQLICLQVIRHSDICYICVNRCWCNTEVVKDCVALVSTSFSGDSILSQICRYTKIVEEEVYILIDMLVLPIFDFRVVLSMN